MKNIHLIILAIFALLSTIVDAEQQETYEQHRPNSFIANKGQWPDQVLYMTSVAGMRTWITREGVVYDHYIVEKAIQNTETQSNTKDALAHHRKIEPANIRGHVISMKILGVNPTAQTEGMGEMQTYYNYFIGNDSSRWAGNVPLFESVEITEMYENIGVKYYFDAGQLRYDFIAKAGANLQQISFLIEGHEGLEVNEAGELVLQTSVGKVTHGRLFAYQETNGTQQEVACRFIANDDGTLGIEATGYDKAKDLVIDPLVYSTYLGGNAGDYAKKLHLTDDGSAVLAGVTTSPEFPITPGAYQTNLLSTYDFFISKLSSDLSELIFSTFLGGNGMEYFNDFKLGTDNSVFVAGFSESTNYPVSQEAFQPNLNGSSEDAIITRLNGNGTALIYSTYLGGSDFDGAISIFIEEDNEAIVMGFTSSVLGFPVTSGTLFSEYGGTFICKFNQTATNLIYSGILGGNSGNVMTVDAQGKIYIAGSNSSFNFIITPNAYQTNCTGWGSCASVTIINSEMTSILHSTFIGGTSNDNSSSITLANNGDVILAGETMSTNFPITAGAFQPDISGAADVFVARFNPSLTTLAFSTYLGGFSMENCTEIVLDTEQNILLTGQTQSYNFPVSPGAFQTANYQTDAFLTKLSPNASALLYSTFLGRGGNESYSSFCLTPDNSVVTSGSTDSEDFPTTEGAFQTSYQGVTDAYVSKIIPIDCEVSLSVNLNNNVSCHGGNNGNASVITTGGLPPFTFLWSDGQTTSTASGLTAGTYTVMVTDQIGCAASGSVTITEPTAMTVVSIETSAASCAGSNDGNATAQVEGGVLPYSYLWESGETGQQASSLLPGNQNLIINDANGCELVANFTLDYILPFQDAAICAVTYNTETGKNKLLWHKTEGVRIAQYNLYREGASSGVYELIGSRPFDEAPSFEDPDANPAQQSYRYKLAVVDSCQEESGLSAFHKTIHLSANAGINNEVNLIWTPYEGFIYPTHFVMRSLNNGPFLQIGQVPSTNLSFTDISVPSGSKKYMIEVVAPENCGIVKDNTRVQSNTVLLLPTLLESTEDEYLISLYPNPSSDKVTLDYPLQGRTALMQLSSPDGRVLMQQTLTTNKTDFSLKQLPKGIYLLHILQDGKTLSAGKVVKE